MTWKILSPRRTKTFEKPPRKKLAALRRGSIVKLIFQDGKCRERMWVRVDACRGNSCGGALNNSPVCIRGLRAGKHLAFRKSQVISIW